MSRSLALTKARSMKARQASIRAADMPADSPLPNSLKRARRPSRERGRTRFQALLEATESLLKKRATPTILVYIRSPSEPVLRLLPCITSFQPKMRHCLLSRRNITQIFGSW